MAVTERTALVGQTITYHSIELPGESANPTADEIDLVQDARAVLQRYKTGGNDVSPIRTQKLVVLLYALYLNTETTRQRLAGRRISTRERVNITRQRAIVSPRLEEAVTKYLDAELEELPHVQEAVGTYQPPGAEDGAGEAELGEFEEILWRSWEVEGRQVSCVDLMLPPCTTCPSPILRHPLITHSLAHMWTHGPHAVRNTKSPVNSYRRISKALESYITPRRSHLLLLTSHIFLLVLTLMLTIQPRDWLRPLTKSHRDHSRPGPMEAVYIVWAYSTWFSAIPHPLRTLFLLPSAIAPLLAHLNSDLAWSCLTFSILPVTFLLVLPTPPSLVFLSADFVPLSTLLRYVLLRGARSGGLMLPVILSMFMIFAWSLNGDIYRGFFTLLSTTNPTVEDGIAPFETRVWLFVTFAALLLTSISLTAVRLLTSPHADEEPESWEAEYGPSVALIARERWTRAVRDAVVKREIVPPFNLCVDVVPLNEILFICTVGPRRWKTQRVERWVKKIEYARDTVWIFIMGPLCFPLYLVDRLVGHV